MGSAADVLLVEVLLRLDVVCLLSECVQSLSLIGSLGVHDLGLVRLGHLLRCTICLELTLTDFLDIWFLGLRLRRW